MKPLLLAVAVLFIALFEGADAADVIPDMQLQGIEVFSVNLKTLKSVSYTSHDIYRISKSKLYILDPNREEYFYSDVKEIEPLRFVAGYKTLIFSADLKSVTVTHTDNIEVRIMKMRRF